MASSWQLGPALWVLRSQGARLERANFGDLTDAEGKPDGSQSRPWDFLVGREAVAPGNLSPILTFLILRQTTKLAWWKFFLSLYPKHTDY